MTTDKTPTDALAQLRHLYANLTNGGVRDTASAKRVAEGVLSPAIAALERWGSPVVATKITIPTRAMEQEFQTHYRRGFEAGNKAATPQPTQAQAGAVDDTALIRQLVEALEGHQGNYKLTAREAESVNDAITAGHARLLDADLSKLTDRGANAWAGVDAQKLREGG